MYNFCWVRSGCKAQTGFKLIFLGEALNWYLFNKAVPIFSLSTKRLHRLFFTDDSQCNRKYLKVSREGGHKFHSKWTEIQTWALISSRSDKSSPRLHVSLLKTSLTIFPLIVTLSAKEHQVEIVSCFGILILNPTWMMNHHVLIPKLKNIRFSLYGLNLAVWFSLTWTN